MEWHIHLNEVYKESGCTYGITAASAIPGWENRICSNSAGGT